MKNDQIADIRNYGYLLVLQKHAANEQAIKLYIGDAVENGKVTRDGKPIDAANQLQIGDLIQYETEPSCPVYERAWATVVLATSFSSKETKP
jgi:hypothetical protein